MHSVFIIVYGSLRHPYLFFSLQQAYPKAFNFSSGVLKSLFRTYQQFPLGLNTAQHFFGSVIFRL